MNGRTRAALSIVVGALAAGAALGFVAPPTEATGPVTTSINYYAPVDYGTSVLTCGWHEDCAGTANYERGLDWVSSTPGWNGAAMFNAWAVSPDFSPTARAQAVIGSASPFIDCPATSISVYDQTGALKLTIYDVHSAPGSHNGSGFPIYAQSLSYNGYFNVATVGSFVATPNCNFPPHVMSWFAGNGAIDIIGHDNYGACTTPGWKTGFYFPCYDLGYNWTFKHDLSDWTYTSQWQTPSWARPRLVALGDSGPVLPARYPRPCLMNVPLLTSSNAVRSSAWEFITIGPYHATGSCSGLPETRINLTGRASVVTVTVSPPRR